MRRLEGKQTVFSINTSLLYKKSNIDCRDIVVFLHRASVLRKRFMAFTWVSYITPGAFSI